MCRETDVRQAIKTYSLRVDISVVVGVVYIIRFLMELFGISLLNNSPAQPILRICINKRA
jgi:hypothetical protein